MKDFFSLESPLMQMLTRLGDLIIANALFLLCSIPLVTIGASAAALQKVTQNMVLDEDGSILKDFFRAFRDNFRQATALWLMIAVFAASMVCNYLLIAGFAVGTLATILNTVLVIAGGLVVILAAYMFPLMVRYTNTLLEHARNALILAVVKLPRTVGLVLLAALPLLILVISLKTFVSTLVFWLTIGFGFTSYMSSTLLKRVFRELENGNVQVMK